MSAVLRGFPMCMKILASIMSGPKNSAEIAKETQSTQNMVNTTLTMMIQAGVVRKEHWKKASLNMHGYYYIYEPKGWEALSKKLAYGGALCSRASLGAGATAKKEA